eukprot:scaffold1068_cov375-Prasinococcus_capsulatus_cf.AAC.20
MELDNTWRKRRFELDQLNKEFNKANKAVAAKKIAKEDATAEIAVVETVKKQIEQAKAAEAEALRKMDEAVVPIGNLVHDSVPVDDDEDNNLVVKTFGEPSTEGKTWNHVDLMAMTGVSNTEKGTEAAGNRAFYLVGCGVLMNQALINYALAFLVKKGYCPIQTPFFLRKEIMAECAQLSQFDEELYKVSGEGDDKYLIATSEQPLCCLHRKDWISEKQVEKPLKYCGYSTCFRKEVGSHGRDTLGIFRVHQFEKVEQFCITSPNGDDSWKMHEDMLAFSEEFYQSLGLPYRVVNIVSGALNDAAAKKYDLEAWFPASKTFRELVSCSNCTDYQSRRLEIRYGQKKGDDKVKQYVHMLNSTLVATERCLCCIFENYQTPTGVVVPEVLRPYMCGIEFIPFVNKPPKPEKPPKEKKGGEKEKPKSDKEGQAKAPKPEHQAKKGAAKKGEPAAATSALPSNASVTLVVEKGAVESRALAAIVKAVNSKATLKEVDASGNTLGASAVPRLEVDGAADVVTQPVAIMRALVQQGQSKLFAPDESEQTLAAVEGLLEWAGRNASALQGPASAFTVACFDYLEAALSKSSGKSSCVGGVGPRRPRAVIDG